MPAQALDLDPYRQQWRVRIGPAPAYGPVLSNCVIVTGRRIDAKPCEIAFETADGTITRFGFGDWVAAVELPHQDDPDLHAKLMRALLLGKARLDDVLNSGRWIRDYLDAQEGHGDA